MSPRQPTDRSSDFGLVAWLEQTRVALPLKGVECRFEVTGAIARVELDQLYHQNTDRPLDCTYTFPLPAGAAVDRCELHANGRVIRARVEEKEQARRIYREQKAAGRRAALVEMERENLFTLSLGNVQPGDVIVVRLAWFQVLDRNGDGVRLLIPTCPGVRYIPGQPLLRGLSGRGTADDTDQVPDASRITPPRIDALHPDAAYLSIDGRLSAADVATGTISSPSHPVLFRETGGLVKLELFGRDAVPDRDFVLVWYEPKAAQLSPQSWRWTEGDQTYALVQLRAPEGVQVADGFSQDFHFLVDRSGSMQGVKWQRTCEALHAFVALLGAQDRVSITLFDSGYRDFAEAPMAAPAVVADHGFQRIQSLNAGGGTEMLPAVTHVLQQIATHSAGRRTTVVLITDGEVGNEQAIVRAFAPVPHLTVHTFGIDTTVNDAFLKALARQQRGGCWLQTPNDDIAGTIAALGDRLKRPVLTALSVRGAWEAGRPTWPDLHAREIVTVAVRGNAASLLAIAGRLPDGSERCFEVHRVAPGSEAIKLLWAKERIATLLESGRRQEGIALARQHNLICEGTAFVAWDEAEQTQIAQLELVQPALVPAFAASSVQHFSAPIMRQSASNQSTDDIAYECLADSESGGVVGAGLQRTQHVIPPDLVNRSVDAIREFLRAEYVAESIVEVYAVWTTGDGTLERLHHLKFAMDFVALFRRAPIDSCIKDGLERGLRQALGKSPEELSRWADEALQARTSLAESIELLKAAETPEAVIAHLVAWVLEDATFDQERLEKIRAFAGSLESLPFSGGSQARQWRAFLGSTFPRHTMAWKASDAWIAEREAAATTKIT